MDDLEDNDIFVSDTEEEEILFHINDDYDEDETDDEEPCDDNDADFDFLFVNFWT